MIHSQPGQPGQPGQHPGDIHLPFIPRTAQKLILSRLQTSRFVTAICHRRLGKTLLGVQYLITEALATTVEDFRGYYFGATQKAAKQVAWHFFKKLLAPVTATADPLSTRSKSLVTFRETELQVVLPNGAIITLAGSENIEAYRGIYIDRIVADEVASWSNANYAWFEVLRPAMADRMAKGMVIGTVKGLDMLYEFYLRGISTDPMDKDWSAVKLPSSMTGILKESEIAELKHTLSEEAFEREMECNFFAENPDVLISPSEVDAAMKRRLTPDQVRSSALSQKVFGVDVGRTGDPSTVYMRQGLTIRPLLNTHDPDNMSVADKVSRLIKIHGPTTVFVDAGQGQGVIDRLYRLGHNDVVVEISFNATSPERSCVNLRAAMYYRLKKYLAVGQLPDSTSLLKELVNQELVDEPNNRIKLAAKKVIKARLGGASPDEADAAALCFADEGVDMEMSREARREKAMHDYMAASGISTDALTGGSYNPIGYMDSLTEGRDVDFSELL